MGAELKPEGVAAVVGGVAAVAGLATGLVVPVRPAARVGIGLGVAVGTAGLGTLLYLGTRTPSLAAGVHRVRVGKKYRLDAVDTPGSFQVHRILTTFVTPEGESIEPAPPDTLAFAPVDGFESEEAEVIVRRPGVARVALVTESLPPTLLALWALDANAGTSPESALQPFST